MNANSKYWLLFQCEERIDNKDRVEAFIDGTAKRKGSKDRVAAFIDGTANFTGLYANELQQQSQSESTPLKQQRESHSERSSLASGSMANKRFEFEVDYTMRQQFLSLFAMAKARATGVGFPV